MNTIWLIIWRLQPPHVGHTTLIDTALRENDIVLVLLGGNWELDNNNPLSFEQRDSLLQVQYQDQNILIDEILDNPSDEDWVDTISEKIHSFWTYDTIKIYCWDAGNDSAIAAIKTYEANLFTPIEYNEISRSKVTTMYDWQQTPISATLVRQAIADGRFEDIKRAIPKNIRKEIRELFS